MNGFDRRQGVNDPRLTHCPECGAAVRRVIAAPHLASSSPSLSPANLERKGFTQYRRVEKGVYEKTAGKGPKHIVDRDD
jgi:hypothetical protein